MPLVEIQIGIATKVWQGLLPATFLAVDTNRRPATGTRIKSFYTNTHSQFTFATT